MNSDPNRYVILGQVVGVFGIKGWVKVHSDTDPPANILNYTTWFLSRPESQDWQARELIQGQPHNKGLIAQLAGYTDRDHAAALVGYRIAVPRSALPALDDDAFYWSDLIGLKVYNEQATLLGVVDHLMATGANDVLVIQGEGGEETLIPFVRGHYIREIDLEAGEIHVDWEVSED